MFIDHLSEQQISLTVGTHEYYQYIQTQLNDNDARSLSNHPFYLQIHAYLIEYSSLYQDYLYAISALRQNTTAGERLIAHFSADNPCLQYNSATRKLEFILSDAFLNKTLTQSKAESAVALAASEQFAIQNTAVTTAVNYTYSPTNAIQYARQYAIFSNPMYPDHSGILDGGDCTNFVSQCLFAGGIPMVGSNSTVGIYDTTAQWYCNVVNDTPFCFAESTSWIRASDFSTHMRGRAVRWTIVGTLDELVAQCQPGDIVQLMLKENGRIRHSTIISKKDSSTAYYCAHSTERLDEDVRDHFNETIYSFIILSFQEAPSGSGVSLDPCEPCGDEVPSTTYMNLKSASLDRVVECTAHNSAHDAEKYIYTYEICCSDHGTVVGTCYKTVYICVSE